MTASSPARGVGACLADLRARGKEELAVLPTREEWERTGDEDRHRILEVLRVELYALSALLSDAVVQRALAQRPSYPPYGLARSKFTDIGGVTALPEPYEEGSLDSFYALWKAVVDTVVLHLHRELTERRRSDQAWTVEGVARLLPAFAAADESENRARKRDPISFVYGGLQFGASVCVQLTEVGARVLRRDAPELTGEGQAAVLARSLGPAYRLAALTLDQTLAIYQGLLSSAPDAPEEGRDKPGWLDADRFTVQFSRGSPWRVALELGDADEAAPGGAKYQRLGCPARLGVDDREPPIAALWGWCVEVARDAGLLGGRADASE